MKKLFLATKAGIYPIDPAIAEKYNLRPGLASPFTGSPIMGMDGDTPREQKPRGLDEEAKGELVNDGISEFDNALTLSTSEIIDFSQGVDSESDR